MFKAQHTAMALAVLTAGILGAAPALAQDDENQAFGNFVLDMMETAETSSSIADKIRSRSIELRAGWGESGAVTEEERRWHEDFEHEKHEAKPGGGPPPWAPAHGYRRKFGEPEQRDLGAYTHRRIQEGTVGTDLIVAVRGAIDRVSRGEPVDADRDDPQHRRDLKSPNEERREGPDQRGDHKSSKGEKGKAKGKPRP